MSLDVIILKKMIIETSAEIDGLYDRHTEGLNFLSIHKLRGTG